MLKRIVAMAGVMVIVFALPATAKPVSTYHANFVFAGTSDVLSVEFNDIGVTSVKLTLSCGSGEVLSYDSTSVDGSSVSVGPKANRFEVSAQFSASFTDCDGSQSSVSRFVRVSNFTTTGATVRERDKETGTRTLAVPVEADVSFTTLPSQPLSGVLTEVISKG